MDIDFQCVDCGQSLCASPEHVGCEVVCPDCGRTLTVPSQNAPDALLQSNLSSAIPPVSAATNGTPEPFAGLDGDKVLCPVCWLESDRGELMHLAVHDSLRGDPILGEDAQQRFLATRFDDSGHALDALGLSCSEIACPKCRRKLPAGFLDVPHHILSLVGDARAGKSYYLSVLTKTLPVSLFRQFGITFQDADPTGNAALNDMKKVLFSAQTPGQAKLAKTQLEGAMYERLPRHGRTVALPKPFVYTLGANTGAGPRCSVILYDNAGEHFQPGLDVVEHPGAQHVANASGIMFLFDPFNTPEFRAHLSATGDPQLETTVVDQQDVILAEMRTRIQNLKHLRLGERISTPLAVVVGKCDAWLHLLGDQAVASPLQRGWLDASALTTNSQRVRDLLLQLCPSVVANAESLSTTVMYFPVSAFGHAPVKVGSGDYVPDPARLRPFLAEIPALWLLSHACPELVPLRSEEVV